MRTIFIAHVHLYLGCTCPTKYLKCPTNSDETVTWGSRVCTNIRQ